MRTRHIMLACAIALLACVAARAASAASNTDRSFTATGMSCSDVTWSAATLAKYPQIGSACQKVVQRNGVYYINFTGMVERVADRGQQITVNFDGADRLTLTPPEGQSFMIDGRATPASRLKIGDQLNFYVSQDRLAASYDADETPAAPAVPPPIATPAPEEPAPMAAAPAPVVAAAPTPPPTMAPPAEPAQTTSPLLWAIGVIVLVIIVTLVVRGRNKS